MPMIICAGSPAPLLLPAEPIKTIPCCGAAKWYTYTSISRTPCCMKHSQLLTVGKPAGHALCCHVSKAVANTKRPCMLLKAYWIQLHG
jgi:hypothetical protein